MAYFKGKQILFSPKVTISNNQMFEKWITGQPYDLIIEDDWENFFDLFICNLQELSVRSNVDALINLQQFDLCRLLVTVDLPNCKTMYSAKYVFRNCSALRTLKLAKQTQPQWKTCLNGTTSLEVLELGAGTNQDTYAYWSDNLTQECLINLIISFADMTGKTSRTFWVGDVNKEKIPQEYKDMLTNKNWTLK